MQKYVALLRGIAPMNPAMRNEKLRSVCEELGFSNVHSIISSGNIVFESEVTDSRKLEAQLEAAWPEKLGFTSTTIIRTLDELKQLERKAPFKDMAHTKETSLNVTFLKHKPTPGLKPPAGENYQVVAVYDREICSVINTTAAKTPDFMAKTERIYGKQVTTRTWLTVQRIIQKLET